MTEEERIRKFNEIVGNMYNLAPNFNLSHTLPTDILLENPSFINNPSRILEDMEQTLGLPQSELEEILNEKFNGINNPELKTKFGISDEDAQWLIDNSKDVITIKEFLKPYQERGLLIPNGKGDVTGFGYAHAARINEDGSSHVFERHYRKGDDVIRTPLGGFINHTENPNCKRTQIRIEPYWDKWSLNTTRDIKKGEELTLKYTMYRVDKSK